MSQKILLIKNSKKLNKWWIKKFGMRNVRIPNSALFFESIYVGNFLLKARSNRPYSTR